MDTIDTVLKFISYTTTKNFEEVEKELNIWLDAYALGRQEAFEEAKDFVIEKYANPMDPVHEAHVKRLINEIGLNIGDFV